MAQHTPLPTENATERDQWEQERAGLSVMGRLLRNQRERERRYEFDDEGMDEVEDARGQEEW